MRGDASKAESFPVRVKVRCWTNRATVLREPRKFGVLPAFFAFISSTVDIHKLPPPQPAILFLLQQQRLRILQTLPLPSSSLRVQSIWLAVSWSQCHRTMAEFLGSVGAELFTLRLRQLDANTWTMQIEDISGIEE